VRLGARPDRRGIDLGDGRHRVSGRRRPAVLAVVTTGILRQILQQATAQGFAIDDVSTEAAGYRQPAGDLPSARLAMVEVTLHVHGKQSVSELAAALSELDDVDAVLARDVNATDD
jgi:hypothetical protein